MTEGGWIAAIHRHPSESWDAERQALR